MPNRISDAQANNGLDVRFGAVASNAPATYYFAICTTAPTDNVGTGLVEASGTGYARSSLVNNATNFPAAAARLKTNGVLINWPAAGATWGTAVGVAWFDHATLGGSTHFLGYGALSTPVIIGTGVIPQINVGDFQITSSGT